MSDEIKGHNELWAEIGILRRQGIADMRQNERFNRFVAANPQLKENDMPFKTTVEDVDHMFKYHAPKPDQIAKYEELREAACVFAQTILRTTPGCPDQTVAIRRVREAVMVANAAIALEK